MCVHTQRYLPIYLSIHLPIYLSIYLPVYIYVGCPGFMLSSLVQLSGGQDLSGLGIRCVNANDENLRPKFVEAEFVLGV